MIVKLQYQDKNTIIGFLKYRLIFIYLLNVSDLIFTKMLIATGLFVEANMLMEPIISGYISTVLKVGLVAALLIWIFHRLQAAKERQLVKAVYIINACLGLYILINLGHLVSFAALLLLSY